MSLVDHAHDPFSYLIRTDHAYFKNWLNTIDQFIGVTHDPDVVHNSIRQFVSEISQHTSLEEREIQSLFVQKLGELGKQYLDVATSHDERDKRASASVLRRFCTYLLAGSTLRNKHNLATSLSSQILASLEKMNVANEKPRLLNTLQELREGLLEHMMLEESSWWPMLRSSMSEQELLDLYNRISRLQASSQLPTHPHPGGPSQVSQQLRCMQQDSTLAISVTSTVMHDLLTCLAAYCGEDNAPCGGRTGPRKGCTERAAKPAQVETGRLWRNVRRSPRGQTGDLHLHLGALLGGYKSLVSTPAQASKRLSRQPFCCASAMFEILRLGYRTKIILSNPCVS